MNNLNPFTPVVVGRLLFDIESFNSIITPHPMTHYVLKKWSIEDLLLLILNLRIESLESEVYTTFYESLYDDIIPIARLCNDSEEITVYDRYSRSVLDYLYFLMVEVNRYLPDKLTEVDDSHYSIEYSTDVKTLIMVLYVYEYL